MEVITIIKKSSPFSSSISQQKHENIGNSLFKELYSIISNRLKELYFNEWIKYEKKGYV